MSGSDVFALAIGVLIGISVGVMYLAVNWERLAATAQRRRRHARHEVVIEGGWRDVLLFALLVLFAVDLLIAFFVGEAAVGRWLWSVA